MGSFKPNIAANADNAIVWENGRLYLLDQRALPAKTEYIGFDTPHQVADAIRQMIVRGAPAIGIAAAYGVVLGARIHSQVDPTNWKKLLKADVDELAKARPTAVNLGWALERMSARLSKSRSADPVAVLLAEATAIHTEDRDGNRVMGDLGAKLIAAPTTVITHCNAGALATGGYGTALGVIRSGVRDGKITHVFADETRPWMQGARLTAWELLQDDIPVTLIADSAAAYRMAKGGVGWVIVGADRVVANGDVANKIGTYALAVAAKYHGIKVMVAAPTSTIDMRLASGDEIPIEERDAGELLGFAGMEAGSPGAGTWNPVFDITPAGLIDALVTEKGVVRQPNRKKLEELMA